MRFVKRLLPRAKTVAGDLSCEITMYSAANVV